MLQIQCEAVDSYDRHAEKLREELTLARVDVTPASSMNSTWRASWRSRNAFCRAADLWVQKSLEQRQRFQQLFFPDGVAFDGNGFVGTRVTAPAFSICTIEDGK